LKGFGTYLDLCLGIELLKSDIRLLKNQKKDVEYQISRYGGPTPYKSPLLSHQKVDWKYRRPPSLEHLWQTLEDIELKIEEKGKELKALEYRKKNVDKLIESLDSKKYKIAVKREMQGKTLAEIADELGYSESWIKKLSAEITEEILNQEYTDK